MLFSGMEHVDLSPDIKAVLICLCICVCGLVAVWLVKRKK